MIGMNIQNGSMERDTYRRTIKWQFTGKRSIVYSSPSYPARITENSHRAPFLSDVIASLCSQTILPILSCASSEVIYKTAENNINFPSLPTKNKTTDDNNVTVKYFQSGRITINSSRLHLIKLNQTQNVYLILPRKTLVWRIIVILIVANSKLLHMIYLLTA